MVIPEGRRRCPKCAIDTRLEVVTVEGPPSVNVDVCRKCRGVWCDWAETSELRDLRAVIPGITSGTSPQRDHEDGRCPACRPPRPALERVPVGAFGVDRCAQCSGLWFDGGELGPMLTDQGFEALLQALRKHPVK